MITEEDRKDLCLPVNVIENIGPEFLVYSFHPLGQIVVRTSEEPTGDSLNLALGADYLHLFDDHGNRIDFLQFPQFRLIMSITVICLIGQAPFLPPTKPGA
jgi:hypothetical protein